MRILPAMLCVTLIGCGSNPKVPDKVYINVPVPCISEHPVKPTLSTNEMLKQLSNPDYVLTITADYLKLKSYVGELESVISSCD